MSESLRVAVLCGSASDIECVVKALDVLADFGIPAESHILSAHRTPDSVRDFAASARGNGVGVIIAAAGMAAHLAGAVAAQTTLPVIGLPLAGKQMDGLDALLSTVQMPRGIPVATVAVGGAENAALLAVQILAVSDAVLARKLWDHRAEMTRRALREEKALSQEWTKRRQGGAQ